MNAGSDHKPWTYSARGQFRHNGKEHGNFWDYIAVDCAGVMGPV